MFLDNDLKSALENSSTLEIQAKTFAEFNLNDLTNISKIGNYKYRSFGASANLIPLQSTYDPNDVGDYYSDTQLSYEEYKDTDDANPFIAEDKSPEFFYSLGDCFLPFRPRSGINKARYLVGAFFDNVRAANRPRYYMPSKSDFFKYWSSYRKEGTKERGLSFPSTSLGTGYGIDDVAPFVVYTNPVPANRIVVKMQTNVGDVDLGTIRTASDEYIADPLYGYANASTPKHWKIQVLIDGTWVDAGSWTHTSLRNNGDPIVPKDGYVELFYGIVVPPAYIDTFNFLGYRDQSLIPDTGTIIGDAYIYGATPTASGTLVVWDGSGWEVNTLTYGWSLLEEEHIPTNGVCTTLVNPLAFDNGSTVYREFQRISGIRVAVQTMNAPQKTFDLIEISPRLVADISDSVTSFSITKVLSGEASGLPVGSLAASNGQLTISNVDDAFNQSNSFNGATGSVIADYLTQNIKFSFYEKIPNIGGVDKYVPIKTMYSEVPSRAVNGMDDISIALRDLYFRLETTNAPSVLSEKTTLTYAVAQILDYIGFSNYVFLKADGYDDPVLPYFFIEKNVSVAEILQRIAVATQTAMFFDEYNNFVVMTKEYLLPKETDRTTDMVLSGNDAPLANIESISENEAIVLNDGQISYTVRYIQREISKLSSAIQLDNERAYRYKPVMLWEVAANEQTKTVNQSTTQASGFALGAMALNSNLTASVPYVVNGEIINNIIDVGESVYWLPRYQGYLYANGEIIKFDGVEYAIPSSASPLNWITSNKEYQQYFSNLPFNGKIYPTGRIRIYAEPYYAVGGGLQDGAVKSHGRGQFGTEPTEHLAGLSDYWSDNANVHGIRMYSSNIFSALATEELTVPSVSTTARTETAAVDAVAAKSDRNGIIKNFMASKVFSDGYVNKLRTTDSGTIQSSALVFRGPSGEEAEVPNPRDLISYVYKDLSANAAFRHFGTRMRIIGKTDQNFGQVANGSADYYSVQSTSASDKISINGGSGGIGIFVDPTNGSGYYLEIAALSDSNIDSYSQMNDQYGREMAVHNIIFYKVHPNKLTGDEAKTDAYAVPQKLWGGLTDIIVDAGLFAGQDRLGITEKNSVYDLAIEYQVLSSGAINFYIFINNILVKVVKDRNPLPIKTALALFTRASSECMFENVYAIEDAYGRGQNSVLVETENVFDKTSVTTMEFMKKYAISGMIQSSYLTTISSTNPLKMRLYFDEFGTILRECAYFNIDYDQAYPAFYSRIAKTFTADRAFTVSGYYGGAYGAEFLVFNSADKAIVLDESTGSYLRILGVTFTQNSTENLTVDDYFNKVTDFSNTEYSNNYSPPDALADFNKIRASRAKYGNRQFSMDSMYVQSEEQARDLMGWMIDKTLKPRRDLSVTTFPMPNLQVGDIVTIDYVSSNDVEYVDPSTRFIVKEINYGHSDGDINQTLRLVEI